MLEEKLGLSAQYICRLYDPNGELKDYRETPNTILNGGIDNILNSMFGAGTVGPYNYICIGTTATSLAATDTALENEVDRQAGTWTHTLNTGSGTMKFQWGEGTGPWGIVEAGLGNTPAAGGSMVNRGTFAVVNKGILDTYEQEIRLIIS